MGYYKDVVHDLQWAVMDIQRNGILVDQTLVKHYHSQATQRQAELKLWFKELLGYELNPNAPKQVLELFTNDLLIPLRDSSNELSLRKLYVKTPEARHLVEGIIESRAMGKLKSTYLQPTVWSDGRVRSQFRVYGTLTWRLSSREPNLQNLPRSATNGINIRSIYCAPSGKTLVEFDKMQLEARIPAYASRCLKQIQRFESGVDLYSVLCEATTGRKPKDKKDPIRYTYKQFYLADGYGAGAPKVSDTMLLNTGDFFDPSIIKRWQDAKKADTPEIYRWFNECWDFAKREKKLVEGFGVPRLLYGRPDELRQVSYSWPTQATASGILNRALVRIWRFKQEHKGTWWDQCKTICQVHDSLLFEVPTEVVEEFVPTILGLMDQEETIFGYRCVLPSEAKVGERLGELKEWQSH